MATATQALEKLPVPTRPRLQAINRDFSDLDDQVQEVARIIGLPDDWCNLHGDARLATTQALVYARADWVLRWLLEKLKDSTDTGIRTRANAKIWLLADWMIHVLPTSRCAPHLRDAGFLSILENTLDESFGADATIQPTRASNDTHGRDVSESSETVHEDPQPSRKRKRGSGTSTPSKRAAVEAGGTAQLFNAVRAVVASIESKRNRQDLDTGIGQNELMTMVLRTESAQAARILKCWLNAAQRLAVAHALGTTSHCWQFLDLSTVVEIWESRTPDLMNNVGASAEHFSTECLIPTLLFSQELQRIDSLALDDATSSTALHDAILTLDRLLAKHVLAPSRTAFSNNLGGEPIKDTQPRPPQADLLSSSLDPLRAKLLQTAQIEDTGQPIPSSLMPLFTAIPQLLDLVIRSSPAQIPKSRVSEKPWIQRAFVALAECAGCSFEVPQFSTPKASVAALERCLSVLASHDVHIDSKILKDLFWFHSGLKYPLGERRIAHWPLVAALVDLDPTIFVAESRTTQQGPTDRPDDLANFLFDQISSANFQGESAMAEDDSIDQHKQQRAITDSQGLGRDAIAQRIIIPIMSAFARNRNLLGFISRWHNQLCQIVRVGRHIAIERDASVWEDRSLTLALADVFEQSLTAAQISTLFEEHAKQLQAELDVGDKFLTKESFSSAIVLQVMMQSIASDEVVEMLEPQLQSLSGSFSSWIQSGHSTPSSDITFAWKALCQLVTLLWPTQMHDPTATKVLTQLIERASHQISTARRDETRAHVDSHSCAGAMVFLFTACDCLQTLPGASDIIRKRLRKALQALSPKQLQQAELLQMTEIFCAEHVQLLENIEPDDCQASFTSLLSLISTFDAKIAEQTADTLSQSVFIQGNAILQGAYIAAVLKAIAHTDEQLRTIAANSILHSTPSSISREQREAVLDSIAQIITDRDELRDSPALLSVMVHLMEVPNATSRVSSDEQTLFTLVQHLHDIRHESSSSLQLLQRLVHLILGHLMPNKHQSQNKRVLDWHKMRITLMVEDSSKCFPARLAIIRGTFSAAHKHDLIDMDQYVTLLTDCLSEQTTSKDYILDAFSEIPWHMLQDHNQSFSAAQASLQQWVASELSLEKLSGTPSLKSFPTQSWPSLHRTIARYKLYPDTDWLLRLSAHLLQDVLSPRARATILESMKDAFEPLDPSQKLRLLGQCITSDDGSATATRYLLLSHLVSTVDDKQQIDPKLKEQQLGLLPRICSLLGQSPNEPSFNALLDTINIIIRDKPSLNTQHSIEYALTALLKLVSRNSPGLSSYCGPEIFGRLCEMTRLILLLHRRRLSGRFHLLLPILQSLLLCHFIPNSGRGAALPPWLVSNLSSHSARLTPANASQFSRLLSTLCSPTQSSVQRPHHSRSQATRPRKDLNDPIKAAREYTSQYVYPLLSSFCRYQLYGRLEPHVREKLMAGIWEVVRVGSLDRESLDAMFAGLGRSEKDIWRSVWAEWQGAHGRREEARNA